jgi:sugar O-acyltransferase (sialic acid O-acetyltransferase NeuD family)
MNKRIVIIGASGHGKVIADIAKNNGYKEIVFLDDNIEVKECGGYPVVGTSRDAVQYEDSDFIVAIGNAAIRQRIFKNLMDKALHICTLIHPNAVIAEDVSIGIGTVVMAGTVINSGVKIGNACIINTCSSVDHDCRIDDFVHVSIGVHIAGTVHVGERTWLGAGAIISNNLEIVSDCMIGAGAVVINDIKESGTYVGVPARIIDMKKGTELIGGE